MLGGYDTSRFDPSTTLSVPMPNRKKTTLVVNLRAIHLYGRTNVTWPAAAVSGSTPFQADSIVPQMWLPLEACKIFEDAFNLTWSDSVETYILTQDSHHGLLQENPSVVFTLSSGEDGSAGNFTLSYSVFDLQMDYPYVASPTPYFPLKRANNPQQYTLGRMFLQEVLRHCGL